MGGSNSLMYIMFLQDDISGGLTVGSAVTLNQLKSALETSKGGKEKFKQLARHIEMVSRQQLYYFKRSTCSYLNARRLQAFR